MIFNHDPLNEGQGAIFSRKSNKFPHPEITFNSNPVKNIPYQKHLLMFLDSKFDFDKHIEGVFDKTSKSIAKLFTRSKVFYRDYLFYKFMNFLLDLTSIIVIISMIKLLQVLFSGHLNPFNIMQL